ncbi:MAG: hypothetical protein LC769_02245 [Chloroflexi bacterium]|nr:hypothetical protein [Chloroflexota bacterium]
MDTSTTRTRHHDGPLAQGAALHETADVEGAGAAHGALSGVLETAEYISDRTTNLATNVTEGIKAGETLGAVARQIRTLSANTSLEASRLGGSLTVAEIARQMRLLSQQVSVLSEHVAACLRSQNMALNDLSGAIDTLLADTASAQAVLQSDAPTVSSNHLPPLSQRSYTEMMADSAGRTENRTNG